jgi:hypothetical protein
MRSLICLTALLSITLPARADDKPAALSDKEIADGWIQLFDGESTFGWAPAGESKWTVFQGILAATGENATIGTTAEFGDYELRLQYQMKKDGKAFVRLGCDLTDKEFGGTHGIDLDNFGTGWAELEVTKKGGDLTTKMRQVGLLGGSEKVTGTGGAKPAAGPGSVVLGGSGVAFRNVKLRPLGTTSLFNGKDLKGWKEFAGDKYKSKFAVNDKGELTLKDGPGDLQTEGQWDDFVLQIECRSNGDHLNSGVFFRCRPGEYQQGYEAQIRNEFKAEANQEYVIEVYDPKTHELVDKKKEKYAAVDYGTGAIYRRQPARKEVAKDREWFTMTVVASGRHLATWVNGVQVTDWTDNRPQKDNARNGCCLDKGAVSLQGHDATTDLSFRNVRLAELPKREGQKKE